MARPTDPGYAAASRCAPNHREGDVHALLAHLSLSDVKEHGRIADPHALLRRRWLTYEVDPQLQFDYPAMSDTCHPTTAAMVRAMRAADHERTTGNPVEYKLTVDRFSQALAAAESAAAVP